MSLWLIKALSTELAKSDMIAYYFNIKIHYNKNKMYVKYIKSAYIWTLK